MNTIQCNLVNTIEKIVFENVPLDHTSFSLIMNYLKRYILYHHGNKLSSLTFTSIILISSPYSIECSLTDNEIPALIEFLSILNDNQVTHFHYIDLSCIFSISLLLY